MDSIAVVIPNFNQSKYAIECLNSVCEQIVAPQECIIVDDCSTADKEYQNLESIVTETASQNLHIKFKLLKHNVNKKLPATRNTAIKEVKSQWILPLDMDDVIPPNYISTCKDKQKNTDADIVYCNSFMFGIKGKEYLDRFPDFDKIIHRSRNFINCSAMYRWEMWDKLGGYDEAFVDGFEDYEFWIRAVKAGYKPVHNDKCFLGYRQKEGGGMLATLQNPKKFIRLRNQMRTKHGDYIFW